MKHLIIATFAVATSIGISTAFPTTSAVFARDCGPGTPAAWYRPGGFCDAIAGTRSLTLPGEESGVGCTDYDYLQSPVEASLVQFPRGTRIRVAVTCLVDCSEEVAFESRRLPDGIRIQFIAATPEEACVK